METYNVYKHPTRGLVAVKVGFSWPALFFPFLWMAVKKLRWQAVAWFVAYRMMLFLLASIEEETDLSKKHGVVLIFLAGLFVLRLVPAFKGNSWREKNLSKRGYEKLTSVQATNPDAAIAQAAESA